MGSEEIWQLAFGQGFAFIGIHGETEANEKRATLKEPKVSVTQVFILNAENDARQVA